jgi:FKBP-type peptidyl-prolyl cis-trans isomerase FkpA
MTAPRVAFSFRVRRGVTLLATLAVAATLLSACGDAGSTDSGAACPLGQQATSCASSGAASSGVTGCALQPQPATTDSLARQVTLTSSADGLRSGDIKVGTGAVADTGSSITVHYTGWTADGCIFDTSRKPEAGPFPLRLGAHQVIPGWEEGVRGMRVGGIRRLVIPPALAYGAAGFAPVIPGNATLTFDIELLTVS